MPASTFHRHYWVFFGVGNERPRQRSIDHPHRRPQRANQKHLRPAGLAKSFHDGSARCSKVSRTNFWMRLCIVPGWTLRCATTKPTWRFPVSGRRNFLPTFLPGNCNPFDPVLSRYPAFLVAIARIDRALHRSGIPAGSCKPQWFGPHIVVDQEGGRRQAVPGADFSVLLALRRTRRDNRA